MQVSGTEITCNSNEWHWNSMLHKWVELIWYVIKVGDTGIELCDAQKNYKLFCVIGK